MNSNKKTKKTWIQQYPKTSFISSLVLVGGTILTILGHLGVLTELCGYIGMECPGAGLMANQPPPKARWIGVRIEDITDKVLFEGEKTTSLVQTDKQANETTALLKNKDEPIFHKYNTGNYKVTLDRAWKKKMSLCLKISGERKPKKSEFMNIIQINEFPTNNIDYDKLSSEERDKVCEEASIGKQPVLNLPAE